ncbi:hypothetical protein [Nocardioides endophyticus]|uniref:hypothetical protein n=1 Tax=Nocardioides endophyticus TaxID=1353775 RepID=UPI0031EA32A1
MSVLSDRLHDADHPDDTPQRPRQPHERKPGEGSAHAAERRDLRDAVKTWDADP